MNLSLRHIWDGADGRMCSVLLDCTDSLLSQTPHPERDTSYTQTDVRTDLDLNNKIRNCLTTNLSVNDESASAL